MVLPLLDAAASAGDFDMLKQWGPVGGLLAVLMMVVRILGNLVDRYLDSAAQKRAKHGDGGDGGAAHAPATIDIRALGSEIGRVINEANQPLVNAVKDVLAEIPLLKLQLGRVEKDLEKLQASQDRAREELAEHRGRAGLGRTTGQFHRETTDHGDR